MLYLTEDNIKNVNTFKLFSNPVSGIISTIKSRPDDVVIKDSWVTTLMKSLSNIRYTQSMLLEALEFWRHKYSVYLEKAKRLDDNIFSHHPSKPVSKNLNAIHDMIQRIKEMGKGFLFSHGCMLTRSPKSEGEIQQLRIIQRKYADHENDRMDYFSYMGKPDSFAYTVIKPEPVIKIGIGFIQLIAFPNEHPYITRRRIKSVGITQKGNVYIINEKPVKRIN